MRKIIPILLVLLAGSCATQEKRILRSSADRPKLDMPSVMGRPRGYVVTDATEADHRVVAEILGAIAQKHGLRDRLPEVSNLWTFAYYANDAGTLKAHTEEAQIVIDAFFRAQEQALAVEIDHFLAAKLAAKFGNRVKSVVR